MNIFKKVIIIFGLIGYGNASFALPENDVNQSIKQLKLYISLYSKYENDVKWLQKFHVFMKTKIVESSDVNKIAFKVCSLRPLYFQDCITGSLGFYSTAVGIKNTLDFTLKNCHNTSPDVNCPVYQRMLHQNISQMKFILTIEG